MLKKIVVIGPESTGKSTLCKQLAEHYKTSWVPEFAREYLEKNGTDYNYEDLLTIAKGQIALEESFDKLRMTTFDKLRMTTFDKLRMTTFDKLRMTTFDKLRITKSSPITTHHSLLFIDTDMYVMKVWCEFAFHKCHNWILNQIAERKYDLYLLCNIDMPWVKDALREYPDLATRKKLYLFYKDIMVNQRVAWLDINGDYKERLQRSVKAIDALPF